MEGTSMSNQSPGSHEFEFELDQAISEQVLSKMDKSPEIPLTKDAAP
jgi:hypothetical protein